MRRLYKPTEMEDPSDCRAFILQAIKHYLGNSQLRRKLMETWLAEALPAEATNQILIGPIFGLEVVEDARMRVSRECDVQKYMENHIMEFVTSVTDPSSARTRGKMILFSAINFPDEKTGETHQQSFIVDNRTRVIQAIDPAMRTDGTIGIYTPHIALMIEEELLRRRRGWRFEFIRNRWSSWQKDDGDTFCQSWSLLLQLSAITQWWESGGWDHVEFIVPRKQADRQDVLAKFFQNVASQNSFQANMEKQYQTICDENPVWDCFRNLDVIGFLRDITYEDLMEYRRENLVRLKQGADEDEPME